MIKYKILWRYIYSSEVFCSEVELHKAFMVDDEIYRKQVAAEYFLQDYNASSLDEIDVITVERVG